MLYDADGILLKSVSGKKWVKDLYESTSQGRMKTKYNTLKEYILNLQYFNNIYYSKKSMTLDIISFLSDTPLIYDLKNENYTDIESIIQNEISTLLSDTPFRKFNNNIKVILSKGSRADSSYLIVYPAIQIQLSLNNLCYGIGGLALTKTSGTSYIKNILNKILSSEGYIECKNIKEIINVLNDIYESLEPQESIINKQEKLSDSDRLETFKLKNIEVGDEDNISVRNDGLVNLMIKQKSDTITPFIFTNQIITDDLPRSIDGTTSSLIKNLKKMKTKINNPELYTMSDKDFILEGRKPLSDEEKNERDEIKAQEKYNRIQNNVKKLLSSKKYRNIIVNTTEAMIDSYIDSIKMASNGVFNKDYKNSKNISQSLQIYQTEILSPYAVAFMEGEWDSIQGKDGKQVFKETFNIKTSNINPNNCLIGYYSSMSEPLCDSYMWIRASNKDEWRKIGISTKGGLSGKGAGASITSVKEFIYNYHGNITSYKKYEDSNWDLTTLGKLLKTKYPTEFEIFNVLTSYNYKSIVNNPSLLIDIIGKRNLKNVSSIKDLFNYINNNFHMASFIMDCLKSASFEFIQLNSTPVISDKGLHYSWKAQYPAVFVGDVKIEEPYNNSSGYTKFHIV